MEAARRCACGQKCKSCGRLHCSVRSLPAIELVTEVEVDAPRACGTCWYAPDRYALAGPGRSRFEPVLLGAADRFDRAELRLTHASQSAQLMLRRQSRFVY